MYRTKVGVDLAKKVIQVCIYRVSVRQFAHSTS